MHCYMLTYDSRWRGHMSFDISCVNKIKLEKKEEFNNSIFSKVYYKASLLIERIIDENERNANADKETQFAEENNICNIIAFIGKRGMGKSSAMLSFACSLEKNFLRLPKIDMSMVTENESLLDIILAYMWEKYEKNDVTRSRLNDLRMDFAEVKDSYMRFKKTEKRDYEDELYSAKELKKLARSLRLRESFSKLVNNFLEMMINDSTIAKADKYLVFVIDDLDLVSNNPCAVLEQIKNFLSIPNVIVLTTLDIERSILNKKHELDSLFSGKHSFYTNVDNVMEYATDYMAKIIPFNRRIYMPDIHEKTDVHMIDLKNYHNILDVNNREKIDYEQFCNLLLFKYTGVLTDPKMGCLFGERESLREIVNGLNELCDSVSEDSKNNVETWIKKEIVVLADRINDEKIYAFYMNSSKYPWYRFSDYMVQSVYYFAKDQIYISECTFENELNNITYNDMIAFLVFMKRKLYINDWNEIKNMLWVYSVSYHDEEINNIFSRCIREATDGCVEKDVYLPRVFDIEITNIKSPGIVLNDTDYKEIVDLIKCMLFTDVDQLIKNNIDIREKATHSVDREEGVTPNVEMDLMGIEIDSLSIKISFDYFLNNMCNYDEQCRKLTEWILDTIYDKDIYHSIILERDDIANSIYKKLRVAEWIKWKNHTKIKSLKELFPLKSLGYMVGMAERLDYRLRKERTLSFSKLYESFRLSITEYMKECSEYYFMDDRIVKPLKALDKLLTIADIESVSNYRKQRLINKLPEDNKSISSLTM